MTIVYDFADIAARMNHKPVRTEPVSMEPGKGLPDYYSMSGVFWLSEYDPITGEYFVQEHATGVPTP